ncbi:MAG: Crp/Fnr family transcriptional regulator [Sphingomonas sp.]
MDPLPLFRFQEFIDPDPAELALLDSICGRVEHLPVRALLHRQGDRVGRMYLLVRGWVSSNVAVPGGEQQIVKIHLPGDLLATPSIVVERAAETLTALTPVSVRAIRYEDFGRVFGEAPRLGAVLFLSSQLERVALMDRLTSIGRTRAISRLAAFLVQTHDRLRLIDADRPAVLDLPLTQSELADLLGITPVHMNRTFRELDLTGFIARRRMHIELRSLGDLRALAHLAGHRTRRDHGWLQRSGAAGVAPSTEVTEPRGG